MAAQLSFGETNAVACKRCGIACVCDPMSPPNPAPPYHMGTTGIDVGMLRKATRPDGLCATCAVREWFYLMRYELPVLGRELHRGVNLDRLLDLETQQRFAALLRSLGAEMKAADMDWPRLVAEWGLPIPSAGKGIDKVLGKMDGNPMYDPDHPFWEGSEPPAASRRQRRPGKVLN